MVAENDEEQDGDGEKGQPQVAEAPDLAVGRLSLFGKRCCTLCVEVIHRALRLWPALALTNAETSRKRSRGHPRRSSGPAMRRPRPTAS